MSDLSQPINGNQQVQEVEKPLEEPKVQQEEKPQEQPMKEGKKKLLVPFVIFLFIMLLAILAYIVYIQFFKDEPVLNTDNTVQEEQEDMEEEDLIDEEVEEEETDEEDTEVLEDEYTTFTGEVITAQLPDGWSIVEYFDGEGTESLPDMGGEYLGLTAIDIINPDREQVFTIQAVSGIGFAGCPNYALFDDDSEAYRLEQESVSDEMGDTINITDYTGQEYSEFDFLNVTFRRINDKYFYDTKEGNNYFEPPCVEGLLTLEGLYFTDDDGYKYEAYFYGATEDATEEDLIIVDEILESVELV